MIEHSDICTSLLWIGDRFCLRMLQLLKYNLTNVVSLFSKKFIFFKFQIEKFSSQKDNREKNHFRVLFIIITLLS